MTRVIKFPKVLLNNMSGHDEICVRGSSIHGTNECEPRVGKDYEFNQWRATESEVMQESAFQLNVIKPRAEWLSRIAEPERSVIIGNLRAAFDDGVAYGKHEWAF